MGSIYAEAAETERLAWLSALPKDKAEFIEKLTKDSYKSGYASADTWKFYSMVSGILVAALTIILSETYLRSLPADPEPIIKEVIKEVEFIPSEAQDAWIPHHKDASGNAVEYRQFKDGPVTVRCFKFRNGEAGCMYLAEGL